MKESKRMDVLVLGSDLRVAGVVCCFGPVGLINKCYGIPLVH